MAGSSEIDATDGKTIIFNGIDAMSINHDMGTEFFYKITNMESTVFVQKNGIEPTIVISPDRSTIDLVPYTAGSYKLHLSGIPKNVRVRFHESNSDIRNDI